MSSSKSILYLVNVDWFFISHRLPIALEAKKRGYNILVATTNTGRFKELAVLGFQLIDLNIVRSGTNPLKEFLLIIRLVKLLREKRPHVIHNVTLKMSIYCSIATRFAQKSIVVNAISGLGYNFTGGRKTKSQIFINKLMKFAFNKRGFSFIFQNPDDLRLFQMLNLDNGNKFYIIKGSGVDLVKFCSKVKQSSDYTTFILTARMLKDKGIFEYIAASKIVALKYPHTRFLLAGGIDKDNPASFTRDDLEHELSGTNIKWLGHRDDILELLQESDVMVLPSYREGLPKSLIEAAAVGMPIITTDAAGCRDCVDDGVNGFLIPVGNSSALAEKMVELIEKPIIRKIMGMASRIKAEKEFSLSSVIERTLEIYE